MLSFLKRDPKKQLRKVLGDSELPSFPAVAHESLELIREGSASATTVGRTLSRDPALSLAVLKTVNSAAYGVPKKVESVAQAAGLLGLSSVESLVLSVAVARCIPAGSTPGFDLGSFWLLASWRAAAARALAQERKSPLADQAYTCGLLQDMAIPVLAHSVGERYTNVLEASRESRKDLAALERDEFDWDHAECASWLCDDWAIPDFIAGCIASHHGAEITGIDVPPEISLVCHLRRPGDMDGIEILVEEAEKSHDMDPERVREILSESATAANELAEVF